MNVPLTVLLVEPDETSALETQRFLAGIGANIVLLADSAVDTAAALVGGTVDLVIVASREYGAYTMAMAEREPGRLPPVLVLEDLRDGIASADPSANADPSASADPFAAADAFAGADTFAAVPRMVRPIDEGAFRAAWEQLQTAH